MIRPPIGFWSFMIRKACWVHRNEPLRIESMTAFQLVEVELLDLRGGAEPGIVEQHVEPAEGRLGLGEQRLDRSRIADIGRHAERLALHRLDLADDGLQRLRPPAGDDDGEALAGQRQRRCLADAAAAAGDQSDFSVRGHVLSFLGCRIADLARTISGTAPAHQAKFAGRVAAVAGA